MNKKEAENIIVKYLNATATENELHELAQWIHLKEDNYNLFKDIVGTHYLIDNVYENRSLKMSADDLIREVENLANLRIKRKRRKILQVAALLLPFLLLSIYVLRNQNTNEIKLDIPRQEVVLRTSDGTEVILEDNETRSVIDTQGNVIGQQEGNSLKYENTNANTEYNELIVPYGRRFQLDLADGTHVYLNAGSTLKYPISMNNLEQRQVYLTGEGYFEVAKDSSKPFIVNADKLDVSVLGTEFNVNSYPENYMIEVVLVEGKVSLNSEENASKSVVLKPSEMGQFDKNNTTSIEVSHVITNLYTAWRHGRLTFRNAKFKDILVQLEREYNVEITNENLEMDNRIINAGFDHEGIEQILYYFKEIYGIEISASKNKIIIQ